MHPSAGAAEKTIGRLLLLLLMKAHPMCCSFLFLGFRDIASLQAKLLF
jgi:hypothetical protein